MSPLRDNILCLGDCQIYSNLYIHCIQHPEMVLADNSLYLSCCLLKLSLLQQNHTMHIFLQIVWVALLCQQ